MWERLMEQLFTHQTFQHCDKRKNSMASKLVENTMRIETLPHIWCPGCGHGILMRDVAQAIENLGLDHDKVCIVSGIGCSSRAVGYMDFNTIHTTHGRAIAFATGIKMANPELNVIVLTGDGDAAAIGGNHLIHGCRRNIDITVVIFNNEIYGMTGGQYSPETPHLEKGTTAPYGNMDYNFDLPELAKAAGATFTGRCTAFHTSKAIKLIEEGIKHKGFSVIEGVSVCPTYYGRINDKGNAVEMLKWQKENSIDVKEAAALSPDKLENKIVIGKLYQDNTRDEYTELYDELIKKCSEKKTTTKEATTKATPGENEPIPTGRLELVMSGDGGQGVITSSIIMAEAAFWEGRQVAQSQAYGPEARGGTSRGECIISNKEILFTKVQNPDCLLALTQAAFEKYSGSVKDKAIVVVDETVDVPQSFATSHRVVSVPVIRMAKETFGDSILANIISCGVINSILKVASWEVLERAVLLHVSHGEDGKKLEALKIGRRLGEESLVEMKD